MRITVVRLELIISPFNSFIRLKYERSIIFSYDTGRYEIKLNQSFLTSSPR